jgi:hypothetical protein
VQMQEVFVVAGQADVRCNGGLSQMLRVGKTRALLGFVWVVGFPD